ncbi:hypothetical protein [Alloalcanivorax xenomutans]|uniref:hypothetical protein n=1 Tax=Alloalcanivorax xenomutans TaxID=1094342 RepID=UPI001F2E044C|nr:hypothetical protein [Alloalcanivorax xenomutans]MCE7521970.1 hypothetical protein [Alloalcanivorax xenomutans]
MPYLGATHFELEGGAYTPATDFPFRYGREIEYQPIPALQVTRQVAAVRGQARDARPSATWSRLPVRDPGVMAFRVEQGRPESRRHRLAWGWPEAVDHASVVRQSWGVALDQQPRPSWGTPRRVDASAGRLALFQANLRLDEQWLSPWSPLRSADRQQRDEWQSTARQRGQGGTVAYRYGAAEFRFDASHPSDVYRVGTDFQFSRVVPVLPPVPNDRSGRYPWAWGATLRAESLIPWGDGRRLRPVDVGVDYPDYDGPIKLPPPDPDIRESYQIVNLINAVALPSETPIDVSAVQISLDIDSFAWQLTCDVLTAEAMSLLLPGEDPGELRITINGHDWVFMVEKWSRVRGVGHRYRIAGSSRTRYLAHPYAPRRSHIEDNPINAKQAAEAELLNTGFAIEWHLAFQDWSIPAGVWSYSDRTPIEAISEICAAVGAVIVPATDADTLRIQPRYYDLPWSWADTVVDAIVHDAMIEEQDGEAVPGTAITGVWVSGINAGVQVEVVRAGTAGDELGPDILHDLITAQEAGAARGAQEIAASGPHTLENITVMITDEQASPGLILPGYLIEVQGLETWRGLVLSTAVSAAGNGSPRIYQRVTVERKARMEVH